MRLELYLSNFSPLATDFIGHLRTFPVMEAFDLANDSSSSRLDSWKEIAAFFDRDERTVRRWEKERSLPIHRMPGKARGSVYAFEQELLKWLKTPQLVAQEPQQEIQLEVQDQKAPMEAI